MSLRNGKLYFEDMFSTNWIDTPIHYMGQDFDSTDIDSWINPTYQPSGIESNGISGNTITSYLFVPCWSDDNSTTLELMDNIISFVNENIAKPYMVKSTSIIDQGFGDNNKAFGVVMFYIETYTNC